VSPSPEAHPVSAAASTSPSLLRVAFAHQLPPDKQTVFDSPSRLRLALFRALFPLMDGLDDEEAARPAAQLSVPPSDAHMERAMADFVSTVMHFGTVAALDVVLCAARQCKLVQPDLDHALRDALTLRRADVVRA
jgi:hypothetical protein